VFIAHTPQIRVSFFRQGLFNDALDRREDGVVDVLADFGFDIAWQAATIDHLLIIP